MDRHQTLLALTETLVVAKRLLLALGDDYDDIHADVSEMIDALGMDVRQADPDQQ